MVQGTAVEFTRLTSSWLNSFHNKGKVVCIGWYEKNRKCFNIGY